MDDGGQEYTSDELLLLIVGSGGNDSDSGHSYDNDGGHSYVQRGQGQQVQCQQAGAYQFKLKPHGQPHMA